MKTKILINGEEVEITLTPEQVEAITAQQKPKQWEPQGGNWGIDEYGLVFEQFSTTSSRLFGTEYKTQAQAEKARDAMRTNNRLLAWVTENDDGWKADWNDRTQKKYYILYNEYGDKYVPDCTYFLHELTCVCMSKQNAEKLCKLLNSGEVIL